MWLIFYYTGPFFVPIAYWDQVGRMANAGAERGVEIAIGWRRWLLARGLIYVALALAGIVFAERLSGAWPWPIQPLELRVFIGQIATIGWHSIVGLIYGWSWRGHRLSLILTAAIGLIQLLGLALGPGSYNLSAPLGVLLLLMFAEWVLTAGALLAIYRKG